VTSYNIATVARFLNWVKPSTQQATRAAQHAFESYHETAGAAIARTLPDDKRSEVSVTSVVTAARVARKEAKKAGRSEADQERAATRAAKTQAEKVKKKSGVSERQAAQRVGYEAVPGKPPASRWKTIIRPRR
jgi:hypothetical protein